MPTQKAIAAHLDLSTTRVKEYLAKGVIPREGTLDEIRVAYIRHLRARKGGVTDERTRLDAAKADVEEMRGAKMRGELVPATDQARVVIALSSVTASRMRAIPVRVAPDLAAESDRSRCREIVESAIDEALYDLAAAGSAAAEAADGGGAPAVH